MAQFLCQLWMMEFLNFGTFMHSGQKIWRHCLTLSGSPALQNAVLNVLLKAINALKGSGNNDQHFKFVVVLTLMTKPCKHCQFSVQTLAPLRVLCLWHSPRKMPIGVANTKMSLRDKLLPSVSACVMHANPSNHFPRHGQQSLSFIEELLQLH